MNEESRTCKRGVVYLGTIPPFMKATTIKQLLEKHGKVSNMYLALEPHPSNASGKRSNPNFIEGWIEFERKKDAKVIAAMLNGKQMGGQRKSSFYFNTWSLKYLSGFKWEHLQEKRTQETQIKVKRLRAELSRAQKINEKYLENVHKSKKTKFSEEGEVVVKEAL